MQQKILSVSEESAHNKKFTYSTVILVTASITKNLSLTIKTKAIIN